MNELKIFKNEEFGQIRITEINGEPYFVGRDVAEILGYSNTNDALIRHIDAEDKADIVIHDGRQNREMCGINESGLYSLILRSQLESAKQFKKWVTSEVLPTIRKHGAYMTDDTIEKAILNPDFLIRLATELKDERTLRFKMQDKIEQDRPKVIFADAVSNAHTSILIGDLAKLLKQNGVEIGQKRLFDWMRRSGYLIKRLGADYNMPMQKSMEMGLFDIKETAITHSDGHISISKTVKCTGKGQCYFINKFLGEKSVI